MAAKQLMIEDGLFCKRLLHVAVEIHYKQPATVVNGEWDSGVLRCRERLRACPGVASG